MQVKENLQLKKILIAGAVLLTAAAAVFSLRFASFDNNISVMLPDDTEISRTFRFFREAPFTANVYVTFESKDGDRAGLLSAVDQFTDAAKFKGITRVIKGAGGAESLGDIKILTRLLPQMMIESDFEALNAKLTPEHVRARLKKLYKLSLNPGAAVLLPAALEDPLGFQEENLKRFKNLFMSADYDVELADGHFLSRDGRHALAVIETVIPLTDGDAARGLMAYLAGLRGTLPANISVSFVTGHLHSISNESVIKRDILVTTLVTLTVFSLLFIFLFKDARALLLFLTPSLAVTAAVPVCSMVMGKISLIVIGMGAVISGIAVDYCIHVYVAMRAGQTRREALREISKPVISGALTTAGAFAVFMLSGVSGYRQLALFTIVSTLFSLFLALRVFPYFLDAPGKEDGVFQAPLSKTHSKSFDRAAVISWAVFILLCAAAMPFLQFRTDIKQYDGSAGEIFQAEENFKNTWGKNEKSAVLTAEGKTFDDALETLRRVQGQVLSPEPDKFTGLSDFWLTDRERTSNIDRWNHFWTAERIQGLREALQMESAVYGFSEKSFEPFLNNLHLKKEDVSVLDNIALVRQAKSRFAFETPRGWQAIAYFPDEDALTGTIASKISSEKDVFIVSARRFEALLSKKTLEETLFLSLLIALVLPVLSFLFLRRVSLVFISLIPVVTSVFSILAMLAIFKMGLNVASLVALLVVGGFSIDYGTFMIHQSLHELKTNTHLGVSLSALTAFCGSAALLLARHPVMFSYGTAMVCGILAGYLSAVFIVPSVCRLALSKNNPHGALRTA